MTEGIDALHNLVKQNPSEFAALGIDVSTLEQSLSSLELEEAKQSALKRVTLMDDFNKLFIDRGWIISGNSNEKLTEEAVILAKQGKFDEAEEVIVSYYTRDNIRMFLSHLYNSVETYKPRHDLALKALEDYKEERYHACIPVVLLLIDGLVNDLDEKRRGFFAEKTELSAWDTFETHGGALNLLGKLFKTSRTKTTTMPITIPFRHGIMHGRDLNYDNKLVAAKCWAALLSLHEWAKKTEQDITGEPAPKSWAEIQQELQKSSEVKEKLDKWENHVLEAEKHFPQTGAVDDYNEGSPERQLVEFFTYWMAKNYGNMGKCSVNIFKSYSIIHAVEIRKRFQELTLVNFSLIKIEERPAMSEVTGQIVVRDQSEQERTYIGEFRLQHFDENMKLALRDVPNSKWYLINWDLLGII